MVLVYIENKVLASNIITYLEYMKIKYTTDFNQSVKYAVIAEINKKTLQIINETKTIFIAYLEESKIYEKFSNKNKLNIQYQNKINSIFNKCTKVVVSMPCFKKIISIKSDIVVIPKEVINLDFVKTKKGKSIIFYDSDYRHLDTMYEVAIKYPKCKFYYIGYRNRLSLKEKTMLNKIPNNVEFIKNWNYFSYIHLVRECFMVIHNDNDLNYALIPILLRKNLILNEIPYYEDYFIPSKDCYFYADCKSLILKIDKILDKRISNLSDNAYDKVVKINCKHIAMKYSILLI